MPLGGGGRPLPAGAPTVRRCDHRRQSVGEGLNRVAWCHGRCSVVVGPPGVASHARGRGGRYPILLPPAVTRSAASPARLIATAPATRRAGGPGRTGPRRDGVVRAILAGIRRQVRPANL